MALNLINRRASKAHLRRRRCPCPPALQYSRSINLYNNCECTGRSRRRRRGGRRPRAPPPAGSSAPRPAAGPAIKAAAVAAEGADEAEVSGSAGDATEASGGAGRGICRGAAGGHEDEYPDRARHRWWASASAPPSGPRRATKTMCRAPRRTARHPVLAAANAR